MSNFTKLSRTEMKRVLGGNMPLPGGTCGFSCDGFYGTQTYSKADAQAQADENVTSGRCKKSTWCCDNCPTNT